MLARARSASIVAYVFTANTSQTAAAVQIVDSSHRDSRNVNVRVDAGGKGVEAPLLLQTAARQRPTEIKRNLMRH